MGKTQARADQVVRLERIFESSIDRMFDAWSDPALLCRWFGPEGFSVVECSVQLEVGGRYHIVIQAPDGTKICHFGEYVQIAAPNELVFTWVLDGQDCDGSRDGHTETLVSLRLDAISSDATKLVLIHERLPGKTAADGHRFGWQSSFDSLQALLAGSR